MGIAAKLKKKVIGEGVVRPAPLDVPNDPHLVLAPVTGRLVAMEDVPDAPLAAGLLGEAFGVWPADEDTCAVYAPISGTITGAVPSSISIEADDGTQVTLRVGIDTQEMRGEGFTMFVGRRGDVVTAGECIMRFDRRKVAKAGHKDVVAAVVTNPGRFAAFLRTPAGPIEAGQAGMRLEPKESRGDGDGVAPAAAADAEKAADPTHGPVAGTASGSAAPQSASAGSAAGEA